MLHNHREIKNVDIEPAAGFLVVLGALRGAPVAGLLAVPGASRGPMPAGRLVVLNIEFACCV